MSDVHGSPFECVFLHHLLLDVARLESGYCHVRRSSASSLDSAPRMTMGVYDK